MLLLICKGFLWFYFWFCFNGYFLIFQNCFSSCYFDEFDEKLSVCETFSLFSLLCSLNIQSNSPTYISLQLICGHLSFWLSYVNVQTFLCLTKNCAKSFVTLCYGVFHVMWKAFLNSSHFLKNLCPPFSKKIKKQGISLLFYFVIVSFNFNVIRRISTVISFF